MKGYLDAKELESYKKEDLQELAKQLGVDAEGTKKEIATRCAAVEVDIPDESELTEEDKRAAEEAAAEAAAKAEEEEAATELVKVKAQRRFLDKELNQIKDTFYESDYETNAGRSVRTECRLFTNFKIIYCDAGRCPSSRTGHCLWFHVSF